MREILFRGKCELSGLWNTGSLVKYKDDYGNEEYHIVQTDKGYVVVIPETVGQFTGLTDKNGTGIFDGDIIRNIDNSDIGVVRWYSEHGAFMIRRISDNQIFWLFDNDFSKIEIIGNIYDNPELLNKGVVQNGG